MPETNLGTKTDIAAVVLELKNDLTKEIQAAQFRIIAFLGGFATFLFTLDKFC